MTLSFAYFISFVRCANKSVARGSLCIRKVMRLSISGLSASIKAAASWSLRLLLLCFLTHPFDVATLKCVGSGSMAGPGSPRWRVVASGDSFTSRNVNCCSYAYPDLHGHADVNQLVGIA